MPFGSGGGGGGGLPSQWTVDAHGGLTITPDNNTTVPLKLVIPAGAQGPGTSGLSIYSLDAATYQNKVFDVNAYGSVEGYTEPVSGGDFSYQLGGTDNPAITYDPFSLHIHLKTGQSMFVRDHNNANIFEVRED